MRKLIISLVLATTALYSNVVYSQTIPNGTISSGQVWTTQQWNNAWSSKQDLLTFTPLNPVNNLTDLSNITTARTNLGLGTAATANTGTSGTSLCFVSSACTYSNLQSFQAGINTTAITGLTSPLSTSVGGIGTANGDVSGLSVTSSGTSAASSLAAHFARQIWVTDFDPSACSSVSYDSSSAFNAAVVWMVAHGPGVILLPQGTCKLGNSTFPTLTLGPGVSLEGVGTNATFIAAGVTNANPLIRMAGNGDTITNLTINANNLGTNSSGITIQLGTPGSPNITYSQQMISNVSIIGPCIGIDANGTNTTIKDTYINGFASAGCGGIRVGNLTTGGNTNHLFMSNIYLSGSVSTPADWGILLLDVGDPYFSSIENLFSNFGLKIAPGAGQNVQWGNFVSSNLGDQVINQALFINPSSSTGTITGLRFVDDWFAINTTGDLVTIQNTNSAIVKDISFTHSYFLRTPGSAITIGNNVGGVIIGGDSLLCLYAGSGVNLQGGASGIQIVGNKIVPSCVNQTGTGTTAFNFGGSNNSMVITDNDFTGNSATLPFVGVPNGNNVVISRNLSIDNNISTLPPSALSGTTLDLTSGGTADALLPVFNLTVNSGSTISTISNPGWQGREFKLINSSGGNLTVGGGAASGGGILPNPGKTLANGDTSWCYYNGSYVSCH